MWRDPFEEIRRLERRMNRLFEELWAERPFRAALPGARELAPIEERLGIREPFADVIETDREIKVVAEIPGVDKKDIKIKTTESSIEISAETKREEKEEKKGYIRRERSYGKFYRAMSLPAAVDASKAKASYKNGVLEVVMPKSEAEKKTEIKVE